MNNLKDLINNPKNLVISEPIWISIPRSKEVLRRELKDLKFCAHLIFRAHEKGWKVRVMPV